MDIYKYGDEKRSCEDCQALIANLNMEIDNKYKEHNQKRVSNGTAVMVNALVFFPALFLIDNKSDPFLEIDVLLKRREVICEITKDKGCQYEPETNEEFLARLDRKTPDKLL